MNAKDPRSTDDARPDSPSAPPVDKRAWATRVVGEILEHMGVKPQLEVKDAADGGISIAVQLAAEVPGVQVGKRSPVVDALQFLANKLVNRPGSERRWISIGIGGHPEPRVREGKRPPEQPAATAPAPRAAPVKSANGRGAAPTPARLSPEDDEGALQPSEDGALNESVKSVAEKSSSLGRFFAIVGMKREDRARVLRAVQGMAGLRVSAEGTGRNRRVVFSPINPAPARSSLPIPEEEE
jgi:predicted RNA-binding protein Jag